MVQRCTNRRLKSYQSYGAAGVTVVKEWIGPGGFERFIKHIGPRPSLGHSVDRIDGARGYEPGNVRWATRKQQAVNRRSTRLITFGGRTMTSVDWAAEVGVHRKTVVYRHKHGIPLDAPRSR